MLSWYTRSTLPGPIGVGSAAVPVAGADDGEPPSLGPPSPDVVQPTAARSTERVSATEVFLIARRR